LTEGCPEISVWLIGERSLESTTPLPHSTFTAILSGDTFSTRSTVLINRGETDVYVEVEVSE
jgi:hypothetical protein